LLGRHSLNELLNDAKPFLGDVFPQLGELRFDGQKLFIVLVGGLAGVEKKLHGLFPFE
jgi:hypothetical protein